MNLNAPVKFEYNGFKLVEDADDYGDCIKISHDVVRPDGSTAIADFSPYEGMREEDFQRFVDLGCPDRRTIGSCGPINRKTLAEMAEKVAHIEGPAQTKRFALELLCREEYTGRLSAATMNALVTEITALGGMVVQEDKSR